MKKGVCSVLTKVGFAALALSLNFFAACEIGLGSSVDVEAPKIDFSENTLASGAVVRDAFAVFGSWTDDGSIGSINATLRNLGSDAEIKKAGTIGENLWNVTFSPDEDSIADGSYELSVVIKDSADHETKISRSFIIDNTPPLVVLSRPSTKIGATSFDSYGQKFTLEGKAADDNDVSLIEVNVYADSDCSGTPLKTISLPSVPLTIETDVAEYSKTEANDYSVIYGIVDDNGIAKRNGGTVDRFCKLVVYDGAQRYPTDGSAQSEADRKGNSVDYYYLNSDLAELFTEGYKITELYHILNGTYSENAARATTPDGVVSLLQSDSTKITTGQFRLNPENSPHFVVSARSILESGHTVDESPLTNGNSKLEVEITPGLDGHLIKEDTIGIYLVRCDNYGNPLKADGSTAASESEAKIVWLVETDKHEQQADITQSGSTYKFKTKSEVGNGSFPDLNIGENYYVAVVGKDMQGNNILCEGIYGFQLITSGTNIDVGITVAPDWLSTNSAAAASAKSVSVKLTYSTENKPFDIYRGVGSSTISETPIVENITTSPYIDNSIDISTEPTVVVYKIKGNNSAESNVKTIELKYDDGIPQKPTITTCPDKNIADPDNLTFQGKAEDNTDGSGIEHVYVQLWNGLKTDEATATVKTAELEATYSAAGKDWLFVMQKDSEDNTIKQAFANVFAAEGQKTIKITSVDKVGLKNSEWKEFVYDKAYPVVSVTSSTLTGESIVNNTVPEIVGKTLTLSGTATDGYGINSIKITQKKDGGAEKTYKMDVSSNWTIPVLPFKDVDNTDENNPVITYFSASEISNHEADGIYTYKITVTDKAEKSSFVEKTITLNTIAPTITPKSPAFTNGESEWQLSKNVMISGEASSPATITGIYYKVLTASDSAPLVPANPTVGTNWTGNGTNGGWKIASGTTNWAFTANAQDSASNKVYIAAVDNVGNVTDVQNLTLKVDASSPDFGALYYNITGTDTYKAVEGQVYVDNTKTLTVYGKFKDEQSGVKELKFNSNVTPTITYSKGTVASETAANVKALFETNANPASTSTITSANTYWKAVFTGFTKPAEGSNIGEVKASGSNNAGGDTGEQKLFNISYDDKAPVVSNVSFKTENAGKNKVYPETADAAEYWVNNKISGATFVVAGVATDNFGVESIKLTLDGVEQPRKSTSSVSEWEYVLPLSGYSENQKAEVKIQATDVAGKTSTLKSFNIYFDQNAPKAQHWVDAKYKDIYFRISNADNDKTGSTWETGDTSNSTNDPKNTGVGKKYSFGSWGNDSTIQIRGSFDEFEKNECAAANGSTPAVPATSGLKLIHYAIFEVTASKPNPTTDQIDAFVAGTLSVGDNVKVIGSFAPLDAAETRNVPYNKTTTVKAAKEIATHFNTQLAGFNADKSCLVLVAEDNVGNRAVDSLIVTKKTNADGTIDTDNAITNGTSKWNSKEHDTETPYYIINKDMDVPEIESDIKQGVFTNGANDVTVKGTAYDAASGLDKVSISIKEQGIDYSAEVKADTLSLKDSTKELSSTNPYVWSFTIPANKFSGVASGKSVTAYVTAKDNAGVGNEKQISAATITIDTDAPGVEINTPSDADTSTQDVDLNGTISLSGTADDVYGIKKVLGLCYKIVPSTQADPEDSDAPAKQTSIPTTGWVAPSGWTKVDTSLTKVDATTNWTFGTIDENDNDKVIPNIITSKLDGTTDIDNDSIVWFSVAVQDKAGNVGYSTPLKAKINQNTDRPVIKFTNLSNEGTNAAPKYILKFGTNSQLEGNISDDDGSSSAVVDTFVVSSSKLTEAPVSGSGGWTKTTNGNEINWSHTYTITQNEDTYTYTESTKYNKTTGDYTYTPGVTADGPKSVYFFVKDNAGTVFYTANTTAFNQPYRQYKAETLTKTASTAALNYKSDGTSPTITSVKIQAYTDTTANGDEEEPGTGTVVGGTKKNKIKFIVKATDANGIKDMNLKYTPAGGTEQTITTSSGSFEETTNSSEATWTTDYIDVSGFATGSVNVAITANDQSGLFTNRNPVFMVDNTGPAINISSPNPTDEVTGAVSIAGQATDSGGAGSPTISFLIPTAAQRNGAGTTVDSKTAYYKALASTAWGGKRHGSSTPSSFEYVFNGDTINDNSSLDIYSKNGGTTYNPVVDANGLYSIPVWFRSEDALGNIGVTEFTLKYNPDADKPLTEISYPSEANYETGKDYVTLGGSIRVSGSISIPSLTTTPEKVYIQIARASGTGIWGTTDKTKAGPGTGNYGYTVMDVSAVAAVIGKTVVGLTEDAASAWWGIEAVRSSNAWSFNLNEGGVLNPENEGDVNEIQIRACGVNAEGKMGAWSSPVSIHIDASAPQYSTKLYQFSGTPAVGTQTAEKEYEPGVFLKGQWYIGIHMTDDDKVTVENVKRDGSTLTSADVTTIISVDEKTADIFIKLNNESTQSYTVEARDNATGGYHWIYPSYEIKVDNIAPTLSAITTGEGYPIEMTKQRTSNNVITFGATATDAGSGFSRLAYYFKRGSDASPTIELPLPSVSNATNRQWTLGTAYSSSALTYNTTDKLFGKELSGTKSTTATTTTFTSSDVSSYSYIRKGGIVKMAGTYHLITDVTGNAVTVNGKIDATVTSAFFPAAFIVDNTASEGSTWASGINTMAGDDGDGVVESVRKSGTTWTWDTSIYAGELDDGEVTLVCVAFDVAENCADTSAKFMLTNKTPRLSKLYLATDLNGDGKYSDDELGTSVITASGSKTVEKYYSALNTGSLQEVFTIYGNTDDENNSTTDSRITMRDKLGMAFEFISGYEGYGAGQGALKYKLSVGNTPITDAETGTSGTLATAASSNYANTTVTNGLVGKKFLELTPAMFKGVTTYGTYTEYKAAGETGYDSSTDYLNYLRITLWDSSKDGSGTRDSGESIEDYTNSNGIAATYKKYTGFGDQWTAFNIPLYMDLIDGVVPTVTIDNPIALSHIEGTGDDEHEVADGHVDLKATLSSLTGSNEFDRDDKVSGKIKFTGTINDDKRVSTISLAVNKQFTLTNAAPISTYTAGSGFNNTTATPADGITFKILSSTFSTTTGHTVEWELEVDTEEAANLADTDVVFTLTANDGVGNGTDTHQVDIVPYITGFNRPNAKTSTHRSRRGKYQVVLGESIDISGFNFPNTAATVTEAIKLQVTGQEKLAAGTVKTSITPANGYTVHSMSFTVPGTSGFIKVVTNGVSSVNNFNSGNEIINPDYAGDVWNDDIYLNVWKNDEYFYFSNDPISPSMDRYKYNTTATDVRYTLYGGWATQGSRFYASYPNTTGSGSPGNAPSPAKGSKNNNESENFGDPATFYDVVTDGQNRYNVLLDCWQGNTRMWGRNFVINKNGSYTHNGCQGESDTITASSSLLNVVERMGGNKHPDNADSSDGQDEMFNQFLNPRITVSSTGEAYITYYDRYAKCLKWAMIGDFNGNNPRMKYATEGVWLRNNNNASYTANGTNNGNGNLSAYYTNGGMVVAGYDTTQNEGTKSNLDVGKWSDIAIDSASGKPVIAYYDTTNKQLMIATSAGDTYPVNTNSPVLTGTETSATQGNAWTRQAVTGSAALRLGEYVSLALDGSNNIHIACKGAKDGALYYVYGEKGAYGTYDWAKPVCVDNNGSPGNWTDIKLTNPDASGAAAGPVISYYDPTNDDTEDALKVAYLESDSSFIAANWDTMTVPCNSAATANRITLALDVTDGESIASQATTSNNSKLAVGYVSSRFDCVYLRKE